MPPIIKTRKTYDEIAVEIIDETAQEIATAMNEIQMRIDAFVEANGGDFNAIEVVEMSGSTVVQREVDSIINRIQKIARQVVNKAWREGYADELQARFDLDKKFRWQVESGKPCPDCSRRSGEVRTLAEWNLAGLPKSGWSVCGSNCWCTIHPVK